MCKLVEVNGKWALITGASRGIGKLAALFMAKKGCNLILQCRDKAKMDTVLREVKEAGVEAYAVEAEFTDLSSVENMLNEIDKLNVKVEIILNNAGYQVGYRTDYYATPVSDYSISFNINTIAPMMICYHFLPKMIEQGFGRIVNTTSGIALEPEQAGYSASKAALDKVTIDIGSRLEGTGVLINLTDPGWCRTDLGGPKAPNAPESAIPGVVVGAFVNDGKSGRLFPAAEFHDMTLEEAVKKAESL